MEFMDVSENNGTPKSSILKGFSIINHPFLGYPYFWKNPYALMPFFESRRFSGSLRWGKPATRKSQEVSKRLVNGL